MQYVKRYSYYGGNLWFEIYNEPNDDSGNMSYMRWKYIQLSAVATIRKLYKYRLVVLTPKNFNTTYELSLMTVNRSDKNIVADALLQ